MFDTRVTSPLVSGVGASSLFGNIRAVTDTPDESFLASLRALLHGRIGDGHLNFRYKQTNTDEVWNDDELKPEGETISLVFFRLAGREEIGNKLRAELDSCDGIWDGWKKIDKVTVFFRSNNIPVYCLVNEWTRSVALFVLSRFNTSHYHALQVGIPVYFPWYFDPKNGATPLERRLLESLNKEQPEEYSACMEEFAELYNLKEEGIRALVGDIETRYEKVELDRTRGNIMDITDQINSYNRTIRDLLKQKRELNIRMLGLMSRTKEELKESPLVGFFKNNRHAEVVASDSDSITVLVRDTVSIYDEFEAERAISNKRSLLYSCDGNLSNSDMELLMTAIFLEKRLKMNFCAAYQLYLYGSVDGLRGYNYGTKYSDCMPNPHIEHYSCIGDYEEIITDALKNGDLVGAVQAVAASGASLNFGDGAVMEVFVDDIQGNGRVNDRCIVLPDGSVVTPADAVEYLRKEQ